jgi:hypothetical protein
VGEIGPVKRKELLDLFDLPTVFAMASLVPALLLVILLVVTKPIHALRGTAYFITVPA